MHWSTQHQPERHRAHRSHQSFTQYLLSPSLLFFPFSLPFSPPPSPSPFHITFNHSLGFAVYGGADIRPIIHDLQGGDVNKKIKYALLPLFFPSLFLRPLSLSFFCFSSSVFFFVNALLVILSREARMQEPHNNLNSSQGYYLLSSPLPLSLLFLYFFYIIL